MISLQVGLHGAYQGKRLGETAQLSNGAGAWREEVDTGSSAKAMLNQVPQSGAQEAQVPKRQFFRRETRLPIFTITFAIAKRRLRGRGLAAISAGLSRFLLLKG
ncbi:hypothetical protein AA309_20445 [Microvirga vignae]|uniref:Uncharacterized protein n=1 Tax=Microvirga vignae TaxID=1225564 RepID=A0A0H1RFS4_9HYPH|nr:hypothetical protein [Microvirga vignae]KLK91457.1 hypothetical protein AA309_20445 [Microvirga vignae]